MRTPSAILLTGSQAAGKSTVARLVAGQLDPSVVIDLPFHRVIVNGAVDYAIDRDGWDDQLRTRYLAQARVVDTYWRAGFNVVWTDCVFGEHVTAIIAHTPAPLRVVALVPHPQVVADREAQRPGDSYRDFLAVEGGTVVQFATDWDRELRENTPGVDLYLDSSALSAKQTAATILEWLAAGADGRA